MEKQKLQLEPGKRYKGYFWINDYGEIQVKPTAAGTKPMNMKIVLETNLFTLYESKNLFKVSLKIEKKTITIPSLTNIFMFVISQITQYIKK